MTADELRAAIARDCPHRLDDYDRHRTAAGRNTATLIRLWRIEHAISSRPDVEQQIAGLYEQVQNTDNRAEAISLFEQISRIRHDITDGLR